jgi:hypothetical protein
MSSLIAKLSRLEALSDYCNAIVVKEVRQALKSRQFVGTFLLLLLVAWGGSIYGVSVEGDSIEYGSSAEGFFTRFFWVLCVASLIIAPYATYRSIVEERAENTLELVQITALSPRQIVWGKSLSALVQVLVYFSAIAPFIAFTALLPGFDFLRTAFALVALLIASFAFSSVALSIGAQTKNKISQSFGSLAVIVLALIGMLAFGSLIRAVGEFFPMGEATTWWGTGIIVFIALSTSYLCQQVAIAHLTFESDNRSSAIRLTATAQWVLAWLGLLGFASVFRHGLAGMSLFPLVMLTTLFLAVGALYFIAEPDGLSRRVARGLPRSRLLRAVWVPFLPGGTRGLLFGLASLGLMSVLAYTAAGWNVGSGSPIATSRENLAATFTVGYALIYLGAGALLTRTFRRVMANFSPGHLLALLVLINLVLIVGEIFCHYLLHNFNNNGFMPFDVVNPVITIGYILDSRLDSDFAGLAVAVVAVLAVAVNWRAMVRAILEVVNNPVRAEIELEAARRRQAPAAAPVLEAAMPS